MRTYRLAASNVSGDLYHLHLSGDSMGADTEAGHLLTHKQAEELGRAWGCWAEECDRWKAVAERLASRLEDILAVRQLRGQKLHPDDLGALEDYERLASGVRVCAETDPEPPVPRCGEPEGVPVPRRET